MHELKVSSKGKKMYNCKSWKCIGCKFQQSQEKNNITLQKRKTLAEKGLSKCTCDNFLLKKGCVNAFVLWPISAVL